MISNEEKLLKERIRHLMGIKKTKITYLSDSKSERVMMGRQFAENDTTVPFRTLYKLLYMYPDVSADWLITGEGSMYKADCLAPKVYNHNEVKNSTAGGDINVGVRTVQVPQPIDEIQIRDMQATINAQAARIEELERDKMLLQSVVAAFTKK